MLVLEGIKKAFPGVQALAGVDLALYPGEVHALMGENGAGKSTLMRIVGGVIAPDQGTLTYQGQPFRPRTPHEAQQAGIAFIHQELNLVEELTVEENLMLGRWPHRFGWVDRRRLSEQARQALGQIDEDLPLQARARDLNVGQKQMLEIARALYGKADVLIMDEPTAALSEMEARHLYAAIGRVKEQGTAIVYISHRMEEVYRLSDRLTVLRDGASQGTWKLGEITPDEVIRQMVGRELQARQSQPRTRGKAVLTVSNLTREPHVREVSFTLHEGEIVGLGGLIGAGRTEIARLLAGADLPQQGSMTLRDSAFTARSPRQAIERGIGLIPEDRKGQGLVLEMDIEENVSLASLGKLSAGGVLQPRRCQELAERTIAELAIRTPGPRQSVRTLSGGNQQKVVMGKWLARDCKVLILDEPTRGVDVGAKAEIYRLIEDLAAKGTAILLISSDMPELLQLSDRILVVARGRIQAELSRAEATSEKILESALQ